MPKHAPRNPALLRKVGDSANAPHRNARKVNYNAAISTEFRGNASAALSRTNTDRTLGASTRQGWRLSCTPAERRAHGAKVTRNTADFAPPTERPAMRNVSPGRNGFQTMTERTAVQ